MIGVTDKNDDDDFNIFLTQGWVYKRGRNNKSYKKRHFRHQNGILKYYLKDDSVKSKGEMVTRGCTVQTEDDELSFVIITPKCVQHSNN